MIEYQVVEFNIAVHKPRRVQAVEQWERLDQGGHRKAVAGTAGAGTMICGCLIHLGVKGVKGVKGVSDKDSLQSLMLSAVMPFRPLHPYPHREAPLQQRFPPDIIHLLDHHQLGPPSRGFHDGTAVPASSFDTSSKAFEIMRQLRSKEVSYGSGSKGYIFLP